MFVKRKPSARKGPTDRQIYVPYECKLKDKGYPSIRSTGMAQFYYNELDRLGYIKNTPVPPPTPASPHNAMLVTITSSDEGWLEFDTDSDVLGPHNIDPESIDPMFDTSKTYAIYFNQAVFMNLTTADGESHMYWETNRTYVPNNDYQFMCVDHTPSQNVPLTYVQSFSRIIIDNEAYIIFFGPPAAEGYDVFHMFKASEWVIDLSPAQTMLSCWLYDVTPDPNNNNQQE